MDSSWSCADFMLRTRNVFILEMGLNHTPPAPRLHLLAGFQPFSVPCIAGEIELADVSGQAKNLLQNQHCYASELLSEREICVLLGVTRRYSIVSPVRRKCLCISATNFLMNMGGFIKEPSTWMAWWQLSLAFQMGVVRSPTSSDTLPLKMWYRAWWPFCFGIGTITPLAYHKGPGVAEHFPDLFTGAVYASSMFMSVSQHCERGFHLRAKWLILISPFCNLFQKKKQETLQFQVIWQLSSTDLTALCKAGIIRWGNGGKEILWMKCSIRINLRVSQPKPQIF